MFNFPLDENEKIITMLRRGEAVLIKPAAIVAILIYVPWTFMLKYELVFQYRWWLLVLTVMVLGYAAMNYLLWLLNVCVLTDKRLIIITYRTLFYRETREVPLNRIANITSVTSGLLGFFFNLGSLKVHIKQVQEPIEIKNIKNPQKAKDALIQAQNRVMLVQNFN